MRYIALFFLALIPSSVMAQGVYNSSVNHNNAVGNTGVNKIIVEQKIIEFDSRYFRKLDGYFSTLPQLYVEQQNQRVYELEARIGKLEEQLKAAEAQRDLLLLILKDQGKDVNDEGDVVGVDDEDDVIVDDDGEEYHPTDLDKKVYTIFKNKCSTCHNETRQEGDIKLFDREKQTMVLLDNTQRALVHDLTYGVGLEDKGLSRMPPGNPLSNDDVEVLRQWMLEGLNK